MKTCEKKKMCAIFHNNNINHACVPCTVIHGPPPTNNQQQQPTTAHHTPAMYPHESHIRTDEIKPQKPKTP